MTRNILILCTGNSCRSQMAHGYWVAKHPLDEVKSAGIETHGLNPLAVKVMAEDGVDIASHTSNHMDEYRDIKFDVVLTVCDHAHESCPIFPGAGMTIHQNFDDPSNLDLPEEEALPNYRATRDEIKSFILELSSVDFLSTK